MSGRRGDYRAVCVITEEPQSFDISFTYCYIVKHMTTTLSQKYQIVIPKETRERMNLKKGMRVSVQPINADYAVIIKQPKDHVLSLKGLGKDVWRSLGGGTRYIKQERASWGKKSV